MGNAHPEQGRQDLAYRATFLLFIDIDLIDVSAVANFNHEDN